MKLRVALLALAALPCRCANAAAQSAAAVSASEGNRTEQSVAAAGPRRLSDTTKKELAACLKKKPGFFSISALADDGEAYGYARDWWEVFVTARWKMQRQDAPIETFHIAGGMWPGMRVNMHGDPQQEKSVDNGSPEERFARCVEGRRDIPAEARIWRHADRASGAVSIQVSKQARER